MGLDTEDYDEALRNKAEIVCGHEGCYWTISADAKRANSEWENHLFQAHPIEWPQGFHGYSENHGWGLLSRAEQRQYIDEWLNRKAQRVMPLFNVTWYRASGKYYTSGTARSSARVGDDQFKQDLVDTQTGMREGWQNHGYFVVTSALSDDFEGFVEHLWMPDSFKDFTKKENN